MLRLLPLIIFFRKPPWLAVCAVRCLERKEEGRLKCLQRIVLTREPIAREQADEAAVLAQLGIRSDAAQPAGLAQILAVVEDVL